MKRWRHLILIVLVWASCALRADPPDPNRIIEDLPFVVPTEVKWQGSLSRIDPAIQEECIVGLQNIFRYVADYCVAHVAAPHIFSWKGVNTRILQNKNIHFLFTNTDQALLEPPVWPRAIAFPMGQQAHSRNTLMTNPPINDKFFIINIFRLDKILYDWEKSLTKTVFRKTAFVEMSALLVRLLLGHTTSILRMDGGLLGPQATAEGLTHLKQEQLQGAAAAEIAYLQHLQASNPEMPETVSQQIADRIANAHNTPSWAYSHSPSQSNDDPSCASRVLNN